MDIEKESQDSSEIFSRMAENRQRGESMDVTQFLSDALNIINSGLLDDPEVGEDLKAYLSELGEDPKIWTAIYDEIEVFSPSKGAAAKRVADDIGGAKMSVDLAKAFGIAEDEDLGKDVRWLEDEVARVEKLQNSDTRELPPEIEEGITGVYLALGELIKRRGGILNQREIEAILASPSEPVIQSVDESDAGQASMTDPEVVEVVPTSEIRFDIAADLPEVAEEIRQQLREHPPTRPAIDDDVIDEYWSTPTILNQPGLRLGEAWLRPRESDQRHIARTCVRPILDENGREVGEFSKSGSLTKGPIDRPIDPPRLNEVTEQVWIKGKGSERVLTVVDDKDRVLRVTRDTNAITNNMHEMQSVIYQYGPDGEVRSIDFVSRFGATPETIYRAYPTFDSPPNKIIPRGFRGSQRVGTDINSDVQRSEGEEKKVIEAGDYQQMLDQGAELLRREGRFTAELSAEDLGSMTRQIVSQLGGSFMGFKVDRVHVDKLDPLIEGGRGSVTAIVGLDIETKVFIKTVKRAEGLIVTILIDNQLDLNNHPNGRLDAKVWVTDATLLLRPLNPDKLAKEQMEGDKINDKFRQALNTEMINRGVVVNGVKLEFTENDKLRVEVSGGRQQ